MCSTVTTFGFCIRSQILAWVFCLFARQHPAEGERRHVAIDLSAELATIDRLVSAALREAPRGAEGRLSGTLRGAVPADLTDPRQVWAGAPARSWASGVVEPVA